MVALVPGRTKADGHSHTIEKYSKFAYSSKFAFSIARSNVTLPENAPDSMLAFEVHGYIFVKNTIEEDYVIDENKIVYGWVPFPGIRVRTTILPTGTGHVRTHEICSEIPCRAYNCGFALSTDDYKPFTQDVDEAAQITNGDGYCRVKSLAGNGKAEVLVPDPNTNLVHPKTRIPMAVYEIAKGVQTIRTEVEYL